MSSPSNKRRPSVTLALPEGDLRERVLSLLENVDVEVEVLDPEDELEEQVQASDADVVLVSSDQIDTDELDAVANDAGIAIIGEEDPARRAQLMAAGASHVLTGEQSDEGLEMSLEALVEAEAAGGLSGPEVGGADAQPRIADFLTESPRMQEFVQLVQRVIPADTSLLITGATGVGKERLARAIHIEGPRAEGPFVAVNCAALPEQLLESELFGHTKGAFTGAEQDRKGHFQLASGGTIFLDEIGEMPPHLQVKLLTVLQRHEVTPLGSDQPVRVDVRLMAATNRDLETEVREGRFREDLFYRLNVVPLRIPSLAERPEDVPDLAGRFIQYFREKMVVSPVESISEPAVAALMSYSWPGNVRELINTIERAMLLSSGPEIRLDDLPPAMTEQTASSGASPGVDGGHANELPDEWLELPIREMRDLAVARAEKAYLRAVLTRTKGVLSQAAKLAGLGARALYEKMRRYDLRKEDFKK